jgi:predicted dehydrogenase
MSNEKPLRWGFMGASGISSKNVRAATLSPSNELVAIASRSLERAEEWCKKHGVSDQVKRYGSYDDMLKDPAIDAVYLSTPTTTHVEWVTKIANAKKHVLCEKPITVNVGDLDAILAVCEKNNVRFMDGVMFMHHPRMQRLHERLYAEPANFCGKVQRVTSAFTWKASQDIIDGDNIRTRADGDPLGCLGDVGWYCIRIAMLAYNYATPHSVLATSWKKNKNGVLIDLAAEVYWDAEQTQVLQFHCSFMHMKRMWVEIVTENGKCITMDDFVHPKVNSESSFTVQHMTPERTHLDLETVSLEFNEVVRFFNESQETNMFGAFADLVHKWNQGQQNQFWTKVARLSQLIVDAIVLSVESKSKIVLTEKYASEDRKTN